MSSANTIMIEGTQDEALSTKRALGIVFAVAALLIFWFVPMGLEMRAQRSVGVATFMIILWATEGLDVGITSIIGIYLFWALGLASPALAFGGFASDTTWFMLGALLIGTMTAKSGLGVRIGYSVLSRAGTSYSIILLAFLTVGFLLVFVIPSGVARIVILASLAIGVMRIFEVDGRSNIARGLFVMLTYTATIFDKMIVASAPSILSRGMIETVGKVPVTWSKWFIAFLPCDIITILVAWRTVLWLFPPEVKELPGGKDVLKRELAQLGPWTSQEKKCAFFLLCAISFWMTDSVHHIAASTIGIGIGLAALLPKVGFLNPADFRRINLSVFFLVGGAICMTNVLIDTKAIGIMTDVMFSWMTPVTTGILSSSLVLYWTAFVYHILAAGEVSMLATSVPPLMQFAANKGFDPLTVGMLWTLASGAKLFAYQSAGLITGYAYGYFDARDLMKVGIIMSILESLLLIITMFLYWPLLGIHL